MPHHYFDYGYMMGWGWGGWILMILWWLILLFGLTALIHYLISGSSSKKNSPKSALDILKERYAKGEISKKEFEEIKKELIN